MTGDAKLCSVLRSLLSNRMSHVTLNNRKSKWFHQTNGLPQGSVLCSGIGGGAGPGPCLAPRGYPACAWGVWVALGTPCCGWIDAGPGVGLVALGPLMCPQVFYIPIPLALLVPVHSTHSHT